MHRTRILVLLALLGTYGLIVFGGFVASSGSGMGCGPDWPLCNGALVPVLQGDTLIEYGHRLFGGVVGILVILPVFRILRNRKEHRRALAPAVAAAGLLAVQVILGAVTVWNDLPIGVTTVHLLTGMAFFACLLWLWQCLKERPQEPAGSVAARSETVARMSRKPDQPGARAPFHLFGCIALLAYVTLGLGAYVKHAGAGLACGWLNCGSRLLPATPLEWSQTLHRLAAVLLAVLVLGVAFRALRERDWPWSRRMLSVAAAGLVLVQIGLGVTTILSGLALTFAVLHLAVGTALFAVLSALFLGALPAGRPQAEPAFAKPLSGAAPKAAPAAGRRP